MLRPSSISVKRRWIRLGDVNAVITCPVCQNRRIDKFTAGTALPCVKCPYKVIVLFGIHSAFTLGTLHLNLRALYGF